MPYVLMGYCYGNKIVISKIINLGKPKLSLILLKVKACIYWQKPEEIVHVKELVLSVCVFLSAASLHSQRDLCCSFSSSSASVGNAQGLQASQCSAGDSVMRGICCHSEQALGTQKMVQLCRQRKEIAVLRYSSRIIKFIPFSVQLSRFQYICSYTVISSI